LPDWLTHNSESPPTPRYATLTTHAPPRNLPFVTQSLESVRRSVYVDVVLNHMTGGGSGTGSDNSSFDGETQSYPGVPYNDSDFHGHADCHTKDLNIHVRSPPLSLCIG